MIRRPPRSTRTDTLFPYTTLFRSYLMDELVRWSGPIKSRRTLAMPSNRRTTWIDPGDLGAAAARIFLPEGDSHPQQLSHLNKGNDYVLFSESADIIHPVLHERAAYSDSEAFEVAVMGAGFVCHFG